MASLGKRANITPLMTKKILLALVLVVIAIQFFRPAQNVSSELPGKDDVGVRFPPSPHVQHLLAVACYDCHSNNTRYPWYAQVEPVGWWLASHVKDGKRHLNFSVIGSYTPKRLGHAFSKISDQVTEHDMPLGSYTLIHRDARLSAADIRAVADWADGVHDRLVPQD